MKYGKTIWVALLAVAAGMLAWFCVDSILTPLNFESTRADREVAVQKNLVAIRIAETEYEKIYHRYTDNADSLLIFLKTQPKKEVKKEGTLNDSQLSNLAKKIKDNPSLKKAGVNEEQYASMIIYNAKQKAIKANKGEFENDSLLYDYIWKNDKTVAEFQLAGFRRDTIETNMIQALYNGEYDEQSIDKIILIPYTNGVRYTFKVNNDYQSEGRNYKTPLLEVTAHYNTYLADQDAQELANLIDKEEKLHQKELEKGQHKHFPGLRIGNIEEPNGNAGNWE